MLESVSANLNSFLALSVIAPLVVRLVSVPTLVKLEPTTDVPSVVAFNTTALFILYDFPLAMFKCSEDVQLSFALSQINVLSVAPFNVIPPPSAVVSLGELTEPNSIFLSSTVIVVELIVVVVPFTVKSPAMVTFL